MVTFEAMSQSGALFESIGSRSGLILAGQSRV